MRVFRTLGGKAIIKETDPLATQARILRWPPGRRCVPYMESGRQRWLSGTLDISDDLTGCNGPCPGTPLANGDPSAALAIDGRAQCCAKAPPSSFTGSMPEFIQSVYGSKRDDVAYDWNGRISIAGVTFGHDYTHSSILYLDDSNQYWVLTLDRMQAATIQKWKPCNTSFGFENDNDIAYGLAWLTPDGEAISLECDGVLNAAGQTVHYGWHATKSGTEGHIVLLNGSANNEYKGPKLCRYELSDSAVAQNDGETWEAYLQRRFLITFSVLEQHNHTSVAISIVVPTYSSEEEAQGKLILETGLAPSVSEPPQTISDAPLYCRYTADDVLEVVRFSQFIGEQNFLELQDYACDDCVTQNDLISGRFSCLSFGPVVGFSDEADLGEITLAQGFHYVGSDGDWNGGTWEGLTDREQALAFQYSRLSGTPPFTDLCGHEGQDTTNYFKQWTTMSDMRSIEHVLILPEGAHEALLIFELETTRKTANTGGPADDTVGTTDWVQYVRRLHYFPDDGEAQILDTLEHEDGEDYEVTFDCLGGVVGLQDPLPPIDETDIYIDLDIGQYFALIPFSWPDPIYVDSISDRRSFNLGHRNSWLVPDKSIERHDGYDDLVADACFVGKS